MFGKYKKGESNTPPFFVIEYKPLLNKAIELAKHKPQKCIIFQRSIAKLPKTRSGKILRSTMRKIANAEPYAMPSTIDDPSILGEVEEALKKIGYAQNKK